MIVNRLAIQYLVLSLVKKERTKHLVFALLLDDGDVDVPSPLKKCRSTGLREMNS